MRDDIEEEPYELEEVEAILHVLWEQLDYLNLMLLYARQNSLDIKLVHQHASALIFQLNDTVY